MGLLLLFGVFASCVIIGLPVAFALGIAALSAFWFEGWRFPFSSSLAN